MITHDSTLEDVCFIVSQALEFSGIEGVLTGGSAAAVYAPQYYMSDDADFIVDAEHSLEEISKALAQIGFYRLARGRIFGHNETQYTIDFPKGPLSVGGDYVTQTNILKRGNLRLRILTRTDCIRDRLAHFYFWNDYTALNAAVNVATRNPGDVDMRVLRDWTERESLDFLPKFHEFERRLGNALQT